MDSQLFSLVIGVAGFVMGLLLGGLVMRSLTTTTAAQGKAKIQTKLALAQEHVRILEENCDVAIARAEALKLQAAHGRDALALVRKEHAPLLERALRIPVLETELLRLQGQATSNRQELLHLTASGAGNTESLKRVSARLVEVEGKNAALHREAAARIMPRHDPNPRPAPVEASATPTKLPMLEAEVSALQDLAKTIQQEFRLLAELNRRVTATSATLQELGAAPQFSG